LNALQLFFDITWSKTIYPALAPRTSSVSSAISSRTKAASWFSFRRSLFG
jgi:hypothetical protein